MDINDQTNFAATLASTDNMIKQRIADLSEEERTPVYDMYRVATTLLGETHLHRFRRYNLTQEVSMLTFHVRVLDLCVVETQRVHKECEQHGLNKSAFVVTSHETGPFWSQVEDDLEVTVDGVNTDFFWSVETQGEAQAVMTLSASHLQLVEWMGMVRYGGRGTRRSCHCPISKSE